MLNAVFTMCFKDVKEIAPHVLDNIQMSTPARTKALTLALSARYDIYEIAGETIPEFQLFLTNTFNQWVFYFEQLLDAYEQEFDWRLGDVETLDITHGTDMTRVMSPAIVTTTENYDLPRSSTSESRPSSKTISTPSGTDTVEDDGERTEQGTRSLVNLVKQRMDFMRSVRNLYADFAEKFKPCFLSMFM